MYRGVQRDEARQAEKRKQRAIDLEMNRARERELVSIQPVDSQQSLDDPAAPARSAHRAPQARQI